MHLIAPAENRSLPEATIAPRSTIAYFVGTFPNLTETFVVREVRGLEGQGFQVHVFAVKRPKNIASDAFAGSGSGSRLFFARPDSIFQLLVNNVTQAVQHPRKYFYLLGVFAPLLVAIDPKSSIRAFFQLFCGVGFSPLLQRLGVTHLHSHFTAGSNMAFAASYFTGIPFSWTAHASGDLFVKPMLLDAKLRHAAFVIPVCEYSRKYLDSLTGYRYSEKLHRIYNGVNRDEPTRLTKSLRYPPARIGTAVKLVSVGSPVGVKGHCTLLQTCRILHDRGVKNTCEIIGAEEQRDVVERLMSDAGLGDSFRISGFRPLEEVYSLLKEADIFVLLSEIHASGYRDGFPTVILEAMLLGLPVVSTYVSGIPEMVEHGVTGYLVPERDAAAAADAIYSLVVDEPKRKRFGAAGRARVHDRFDLNQNLTTRAELFFNSSLRCGDRSAASIS